jgi:four helix bundle protein
LITFACCVIDVTEALPKIIAGQHLGNQLVRSGTSPALHFGEAQAAESPADFIHKMKICLKELRETHNCLQIIARKAWYDSNDLSHILDENNQLISIFFSRIVTAQAKQKKMLAKTSGL